MPSARQTLLKNLPWCYRLPKPISKQHSISSQYHLRHPHFRVLSALALFVITSVCSLGYSSACFAVFYQNPALAENAITIGHNWDKTPYHFFQEKGAIKIAPRVKKWSKTTGLMPSAVKFRRLSKRWGSCTADNEIIFNHDAVKLPFTLIDYIVVHELCHIKHKDHSKDFYRELAKYMPDWEALEERLGDIRSYRFRFDEKDTLIQISPAVYKQREELERILEPFTLNDDITVRKVSWG